MPRTEFLAVLCLFCVFVAITGQETCSSGPVGFTALTPDQLRDEIHTAIEESLSDPLAALLDRETKDQLSCSSYFSLVVDLLESVNSSLRESTEALTDNLEVLLQHHLQQSLTEAVRNLTATFQDAVSALNVSLLSTISSSSLSPATPSPGFSSSSPARSCQAILETTAPEAVSSGHYWVNSSDDGGPVRVYCHMSHTCGNHSGGWMRVAKIDMTNASHHCPGPFSEFKRDSPPRRLCVATSDLCVSHFFPVTGYPYREVCGRVIAYQDKTPNAFFPFHTNPSLTINDNYVDGVSITHGNPRTHIWTFAAALDETIDHLSGCACTNAHVNYTVQTPAFIGQNYFCDTASESDFSFGFYPDDPLWDGKGCGPNNACCSFNNPPWFFREFAEPTTNWIEMRVCRDSGIGNENIPFELVELYVR